jgi:hypothetical protein
MALQIFSACASPSDPPMKRRSCAKATTMCPSTLPVATLTPSPSKRFLSMPHRLPW